MKMINRRFTTPCPFGSTDICFRASERPASRHVLCLLSKRMTYIYIYIYVYVCMYIYIYIYIDIHMCALFVSSAINASMIDYECFEACISTYSSWFLSRSSDQVWMLVHCLTMMITMTNNTPVVSCSYD